jgi:hypothetical protein
METGAHKDSFDSDLGETISQLMIRKEDMVRKDDVDLNPKEEPDVDEVPDFEVEKVEDDEKVPGHVFCYAGYTTSIDWVKRLKNLIAIYADSQDKTRSMSRKDEQRLWKTVRHVVDELLTQVDPERLNDSRLYVASSLWFSYPYELLVSTWRHDRYVINLSAYIAEECDTTYSACATVAVLQKIMMRVPE